MLTYIANAIGVLAVAAFVLSYQQKTRRGIIICNIISRVLYVLQYILLFAFEGAILDILGMIASVLAQKRDTAFIKKHLKAVIITVDITIVAAGLLLYKNPYSLLPMLGVLLHTGAFWLTKEKSIRKMSIAGSPFWFVYNVYSKAYGSAFGDMLTMISIGVAILRYDIFKKDDKNAIDNTSHTEK